MQLACSPELPDVGALEHVALPITITWWTQPAAVHGRKIGLARKRNPLLCEELGLVPSLHCAVDSLHSLYLGPMLRLVNATLWRYLLANPWRIAGNKDQRLAIGVTRMRPSLDNYYTDNHISPQQQIYEFTLSMLGDAKESKVPHPVDVCI